MARRRASSETPQIIGYVRCSTDEQHLGPEAQRAAIERWCAANGAVLVAVFEDLGVSGGAELDERPGLVAALDSLVERGASGLLVAKRDRLARDVMVAALVERLAQRAGARVLSADGAGNGDGPEALLLRGIMDVFAQYERAVIRSRTRAALAVKRQRGERAGAVPFGYRVADNGRTLVLHDDEQRAVVRMRNLRGQGVSIRSIAEQLTAEGVPARGARWHATTVARVLDKEAA